MIYVLSKKEFEHMFGNNSEYASKYAYSQVDDTDYQYDIFRKYEHTSELDYVGKVEVR